MPKPGFLVRLVSFVLSLLLLSQPLSALASTPPIGEEPPAAESTKNDPRHFDGVSTVDSLTSPPSFDFTDGVSTGAGFSFGDGLSSIKQTYSDELTMPPYLSFGRFIYDRTDGSSIQYQIQNSGIKEEIVLNSKPDTNTISFDLKLGTSTLRKEADGYHVISDAAEDLYTILNPNVRDAAGKTGEIFMDVAGSRATLTVNADFLAHASYPVVIDPTTVASGASRTGYAMQRKIFWDGSRYFLFYSNGANFYYRSSSDGITWSAAQLSFAGVQGRDLAIWNNGADVYAAYVTSTYDISVRKGTISGTTISWGTAYLALDGTSATNRYDIPGITRDSSGKLWLSSRMLSGDRYVVKAVRSTSADSPAAWGTINTLSTTGNTSSSLFPSAAPLDSGKMLFFWNRGTTYEARYFDGSAFGSVMTVGSSPSTESDTYAPTAVVDQTGKVYMGYINSSIKAAYKTLASPYSSGSLSAESVFSNSEAGYVSLSLDSLGGEVYGFYTNMLGGLEDEVRMKRLSDGAEVLLSDVANRGFDEVKIYRSGTPAVWTVDTTDAADNDSPGDVKGDTGYLLTQAADALQVADKDKFERVAIKLSQTATAVTGLVVKYWSGSAWTNLSFTDGTANLSVTDGAISFTPPSDWAKDSSGLYAVQIKTANTPTQKPIGSVINSFPLSRYVSSPYSVQGRPYAFWMDGQNSESFSIKYAQAQTSGSLAGASRAPQVGEDMKTASLSVNTANGNAAVSFGDLSTPARGFAAALSHIYNSRAGADSPYGYNWSLAPEESLDTRNPDGSLSYHSSDGHIYRFDLVGGSYVPEKGLYLTLTKNGDNTYTLKDKGNNLTNFSSSGVLSTRADRNGNTTTYAHDSYGRLTSITDSTSQVTTLTYQSGPAGRLSSISAPGNRSMSYTYDSSTGDLLSYTNAENKTTSFEYDASHQMTRVTDPKNGVYNLYYTKSRLSKIERPSVPDLGVTSQGITYNEADTQVTDPNGNATIYAISPFGDGLGARDADSLSSSAAFDAAGNNTSSLSYKDKALTDNFDTDTRGSYTFSGGGATSYDSVNKYLSLTTGDNLTRTMDISQESTATSVRLQGSFYVKAKYPSTGTLELKLRKKTNGDYYSFKVAVDRLDATLSKKSGGVTTTLASSPNVRVREAISGGASDRWHTIAAEVENGKVRGYLDGKEVVAATDSSILPGGSFSIIASQMDVYLDDLRVYEGAMATSAAYDGGGNNTSETNALGGTKSYVYDTNNNMTSETNERGNTTSYTYDTNGNMLTQEDALGGLTSYTYSQYGDQVMLTDALDSTSTTSFNGKGRVVTETDGLQNTTSYTYDSAGNRTNETKPNGATTTWTYDKLGRELTRTDALSNVTSAQYDDNGNCTSENNIGRETTYVYDALNRLTSKTMGQKVYGYVYDAVGALTKETDPLDRDTVYGYDALGRKVSTIDALNHEAKLGYDATGNNTSETDANGNTSTSGYDLLGRLVSTTNAVGDVSTTEYDEVGNKTIEANPVGAATLYQYDELGRVETETDPLGAVTSHGYNAMGAETTTTNALNQTTTFSYDKLGRQISTSDPLSNTSRKEYDSLGQPTADIDARGAVTRTEYDLLGRDTTTTDALGAERSKSYDVWGETVASTDELGNTSRSYYDAYGQLVKSVSPGGQVSTYDYDLAGQPTESFQSIDLAIGSFEEPENWVGGVVETQTVDSGLWARRLTSTNGVLSQTETTTSLDLTAGSTTRTIELDVNIDSVANLAPTALTITFGAGADDFSYSVPAASLVSGWNHLSLTLGQFTPSGSGADWSVIDKATVSLASGAGVTANAILDNLRFKAEEYRVESSVYDAAGRLTQQTDALGNNSTYTYDNVGAKLTETDAEGNITSHKYDELGRGIEETDASGYKTSQTYDPAGRIATQTDADNRTTTFAYDEAGRQTAIADPLGNVTGTEYDALGRVVASISPSGQRSEATYDAAGKLESISDEDSRTTSFNYDEVANQVAVTSPGGVQFESTYDLLGNITTQTTGGSSSTFAYDAASNMTGMQAPSQVNSTYSYDSERQLETAQSGSEPLTAYDHDIRSNTIEAQADPRVEASSFDAANRQTVSVATGGGLGAFVYSPAGRIVSEQDASGVTNVDYFDNGNVKSLSVTGGPTTRFTYSHAGLDKTVTAGNGLVTTDSVDGAGRLAGIAVAIPEARVDYGYNSDGLVTTEAVAGSENLYQYTASGSLLDWQHSSGKSASYVYGPDGDRTSMTTEAGTTVYTYDFSKHQLLATTGPGGDTSYSYGSNGELSGGIVNGDSVSLSWNDKTELVGYSDSTHTVSYEYDIEGNRSSKTVDGTTTNYIYEGTNLVAERDAAGNITARYRFDQKGRPLFVRKGGNTYYYHLSGRGDVLALTDSGGSVVAKYAYDPWGNILESTGTFANEQPFRYAGYFWDAETGLYYLQNRYYDPKIGRFISKDPNDIGEPRPAINPYVYAGNNPVSRIDRTGLAYSTWDSNPNYHRVIRSGMQGEDVKKVQGWLSYYGYPLNVDGKYGSDSVGNVREFQSTHLAPGGTGALAVDGVVGLSTWRVARYWAGTGVNLYNDYFRVIPGQPSKVLSVIAVADHAWRTNSLGFPAWRQRIRNIYRRAINEGLGAKAGTGWKAQVYDIRLTPANTAMDNAPASGEDGMKNKATLAKQWLSAPQSPISDIMKQTPGTYENMTFFTGHYGSPRGVTDAFLPGKGPTFSKIIVRDSKLTAGKYEEIVTELQHEFVHAVAPSTLYEYKDKYGRWHERYHRDGTQCVMRADNPIYPYMDKLCSDHKARLIANEANH